MTLVALVLVPILFFSSSYFLNNLTKLRSGVTVSHSATQFVNQMIYELQNSPSVLPDSTTQEIHFVFHDDVTGNDYPRGYRLSASGSGKKLERISYTESSATWGSPASPYGAESATEILLPASTQFRYCLDATCAGATLLSGSFNKSVLVKLSGWEFSRTNDGSKLTLPGDVKIYVGTNLEGSPVQLSAEVRELYSFAGSTVFGATPDLTKLGLNQAGDFIFFNGTITSGGGAGGLTTILTGETKPGGDYSMLVDANGRAYFGEMAASGSVWTWNEATGLSTIINGISYPGQEDIQDNQILYPLRSGIVADGSSRVFFQNQTGTNNNLFTWNAATGLSTISVNQVSGGPGTNGVAASMAVAQSGRLFLGQNPGWGSSGQVLTWKSGVLSTLLSSTDVSPGTGSMTVGSDERAFFGTYAMSGGKMWTWKSDTGLSTLLTGANLPGYYATYVGADNRWYYATTDTTGNMWTWASSTGLSTLCTACNAYPMRQAACLDDNNRLYYTVASRVHTYLPATGMSTLHYTMPSYNRNAYACSSDRVFLGVESSTGRLYTYATGTGFSTIVAGSYLGDYDVEALDNGRVFFGSQTANLPFYTWKVDTGLSTIAPPSAGISYGFRNALAVDNSDSSVYFGATITSGNKRFWRWSATDGLSTIIDEASITNIGNNGSVRTDDNGRVYFSNDTTLWTYKAGGGGGSSSVPAVDIADALGTNANKTLGFQITGTPTYIAVAQDVDGEIYFVDSSTNKIDRYTWDTVDGRYELTTQITLGAWGGNVRAVAIDQADNGIALLVYDGASEKKIYKYDNRRTASPTLTTHNLATAMATVPGKPTGLSVNGKTGDYLLMDSTRNGASGSYYSNLYLLRKADWNTTGAITIQDTLKVRTDDSAYISVAADGETNFRILYDDNRNILFLVAPSASYRRVYAMSLPRLLD
ncbi:MAG: hypothetical protein AB7P76_10900 [Candidatus Melainabacteria bacterium]